MKNFTISPFFGFIWESMSLLLAFWWWLVLAALGIIFLMLTIATPIATILALLTGHYCWAMAGFFAAPICLIIFQWIDWDMTFR